MNKHADPDSTRDALLDAGLALFGQQGFDATSTRQIANIAGANISAISYHFGGKDGLRLACADHVAARLSGVASAALSRQQPASPEAAAQALHRVVGAMCQFLFLDPAAAILSQFILREMLHPGPVLEAVYPKAFEPVHKGLCQLWALATGRDADSSEVLLQVFSLLGQVVYFRIAQSIVCRRLGWPAIGAEEAGQIAATVRANLDAALRNARQETKP